jgi:hypothetical protein
MKLSSYNCLKQQQLQIEWIEANEQKEEEEEEEPKERRWENKVGDHTRYNIWSSGWITFLTLYICTHTHGPDQIIIDRYCWSFSS